jgi:DNA-binding CsgD family transcriptional regulator
MSEQHAQVSQPSSAERDDHRSFIEPAPANKAGELVRWLAEEADARGTTSSIAAAWRLLMQGEWQIVDVFYSPARWFLVMGRCKKTRPLPARSKPYLEHALLQESQKRAAYACGVSGSTLSMAASQALRRMGVSTSPAKAPPFVALLAHAATSQLQIWGRESNLDVGESELKVFSIPRPERSLAGRMSTAEHQVLCRIVEGWTYVQVAIERRTSPRTVANQMANAFQRLKISGRGQLIHVLLELASRPGPSSPS